jgi:hypothetical protein
MPISPTFELSFKPVVMKKGLLCALLLVSLAPVFAQKAGSAPKSSSTEAPAAKTSADNPVARTTTEALVAKYKLSADQAKQMYGVQVRKLRNLNAIAGLKTSNPSQYQKKLEALQTNTLASIRRILNTKEQVQLFQKTKDDLRTQRAAKRQELHRQNADRTSIEIALLEIYAE